MTLPWTDEEGQMLAIKALITQTDVWIEEAKTLEMRLTAALDHIANGTETVRRWVDSPASGKLPLMIIDGGVSDSKNSEEI